MRRPRGEDDETLYPTLLGIGQMGTLNAEEPEDDEDEDKPGLWLPTGRATSRSPSHWRRQSVSPPQPAPRPIGFRRPE